MNIPHRRSNFSCSFNLGIETVNVVDNLTELQAKITLMIVMMPVTQLLLLMLVTTVRGSPEHRVSFSEDYNSQLLPPTEVNK